MTLLFYQEYFDVEREHPTPNVFAIQSEKPLPLGDTIFTADQLHEIYECFTSNKQTGELQQRAYSFAYLFLWCWPIDAAKAAQRDPILLRLIQ